jgi:hypothetical protein
MFIFQIHTKKSMQTKTVFSRTVQILTKNNPQLKFTYYKVSIYKFDLGKLNLVDKIVIKNYNGKSCDR